jgi:hypothetical protein
MIASVRVRYGTILYHKMVPYRTERYGIVLCTVPARDRFDLFIYYNSPMVDRGCRPLLAAYHRYPYQQSTQLAAVLPVPTITYY